MWFTVFSVTSSWTQKHQVNLVAYECKVIIMDTKTSGKFGTIWMQVSTISVSQTVQCNIQLAFQANVTALGMTIVGTRQGLSLLALHMPIPICMCLCDLHLVITVPAKVLAPGVGVTKPIFSVPLFSKFFSITKTYVDWAVEAAQLRWHLSNINVIWII